MKGGAVSRRPVSIDGAVRASWMLFVASGLLDAGVLAAETYRRCNASPRYDACECRGYRRGQDQLVTPSTHPTNSDLCNLINLQTAFEYAVDGEGRGLAVVLLRGERYPLSPPVYELRGGAVAATINDGVIRAQAHGQTWTSSGSGAYPKVSLPVFRGYDEHPPTRCQDVPRPDSTGTRARSVPFGESQDCARHPKHQMQIFDAGGFRVSIHHLELDGGLDPTCSPRMPSSSGWRRRFPRPALVELGWSALASGTTFHDNVVVNVAGWTALHLGEGPLDDLGRPACKAVEVYGNTFADLGWNLCDPRAHPRRQCYWTDAVSMACMGSVRDNTVSNPSDVGIVAFVGGVSLEGNVILSDRSKAFAGIAAVDEFQTADGHWVANHDDTFIAGNTVRADPGGAFDVGIAVGRWAWSCVSRASPTFADSVVVSNRIDAGDGRINYGLAVTLADGVVREGLRVGSVRTCRSSRCFEDFLPNTFRGSFGRGTPGQGCSGRSAGPPSPYVVNSCTNCWLQDGYVHAEDYKVLLGGIAHENPPVCPASPAPD
jgi:hypothetical protein